MDLETIALLNKKIKNASAPTDAQVQNSVNDYFSKHPIQPTLIEKSKVEQVLFDVYKGDGI